MRMNVFLATLVAQCVASTAQAGAGRATGTFRSLQQQSSGSPSSGSSSSSSSGSQSSGSSSSSSSAKILKASDNPDPNKDTCKDGTTDFEYPKCGDGDKMICCHPRAICIEAEVKKTNTEWEKQYECSFERNLYGTKVVKIIMIPMIFIIVEILFVLYIILKLNPKANHVPKLGIIVIGFSWPLLLSQYWVYGIYSSFIALFVSYMAAKNTCGYPRYSYLLAWAMAGFMVVLFLGPIEAFHVPFYRQSEAGASSKLAETFLGASEAGCNAYYGGFFQWSALELKQKEMDPTKAYHGLCEIEWLNFVQVMLVIQALLWFKTFLVSAQPLLAPTAGQPKSSDKPLEGTLKQVVPGGGQVVESTPVEVFPSQPEEKKD